MYEIERWEIVGRKHHSGCEEVNHDKTLSICREIVALNKPFFEKSHKQHVETKLVNDVD